MCKYVISSFIMNILIWFIPLVVIIIIISYSLVFSCAMPKILFQKLTDYEYHNANISCQNE